MSCILTLQKTNETASISLFARCIAENGVYFIVYFEKGPNKAYVNGCKLVVIKF